MKKIVRNIVINQLKKKVIKLLDKRKLVVVAITGSLGKTSAKLAVAKVLSHKYKVIYSEDSYNTEIGLPLSLFGLKVPKRIWDILSWQKIFKKIDNSISNYNYDVAVLEMGADKPGDISFFTKFIKPDIGVITAVAPAHIEKFKNLKNIIKEKWFLAEASKQIIYNYDFSELRHKGVNKNNAVGYGLTGGDIVFKSIARERSGYLKAKLSVNNSSYVVRTKQISRQSLYSLLVAVSVANELNLPIRIIVSLLSKIEPAKGRMNLLPGVNASKIIDDSYNSNPKSSIEALNTLREFPGRKIAVLGNMNELGDYSAKGHIEVGEHVAKIADLLIVIGENARKFLARSALKNGMREEKIKDFSSPYSAGKYLQKIIKKGDIILVKGSQDRVYGEEVAKLILKKDLDPSKLLVRQSSDWAKKKQKLFTKRLG